MSVPGPVLAALAQGDCERTVGGLLGQPANAVSSLAMVAAGAWLLRRGRAARWPTTLLGAAVLAAGVGSVAFHGPMPPGGQLLHDVGLLSVPLAVGAVGTGVRVGGRRGAVAARRLLLVALAVVAAVLAVLPSLVVPATTLAGASAVLGAVVAWRATPPWPGRRRALAASCVAGTLGVAAQRLGRTDGPLCDPGTLLQPHAAWHVLAALAVVALADALDRGEGPRPRSGGLPPAG